MKKIKLLIALLATVSLWSCEKDEIRAILNTAATPAVSFSTPSVVLTKDTENNNVLTITWAKPDFGVDVAPSYTLYIDKKGGGFTKGYTANMGSALQKVFKGTELNNMLLNLGLKPAEVASLDVKVVAQLGAKSMFSSVVSPLSATPFLDKIDRTTTWGVVGSATPGSWDGPDIPFFKTDQNNVLVAYAKLVDGEIKFRENNAWDNNVGDNGADGTVEKDGANIAAKAGNYKITYNLNTKTYKMEKFMWGIVGSATPSGWGAPDIYLNYDPINNVFKAIAPLVVGEIKFRKNEDWGENYGDTGANGTLDAGGDNIAVAKAGNYLVTFDPANGKYKVEKIDVYGIVGSATKNGWNGPDDKFTLDFTQENAWVMNGVKLVDGEIKFRTNDDWGLNYGDNGADGTLEKDGANIAVKAGTYNITLNFKDPAKPTYKLVKK
ncbi:MAG: SusF/SusE family outer membrane protein [Spirosomataceae bacterium]